MNTAKTEKTRVGLSLGLLALAGVLGGTLLLQGADEGKGGSKLLPSTRASVTGTASGGHCDMHAGDAKKDKPACCSAMGGKDGAGCKDKADASNKSADTSKDHSAHH